MARMGDIKNTYKVLVMKLLENFHLEDQAGDGKTLCRWEVDGTGSGSFPMAYFNISSVC
jgi:hypothetical protein